VAEGFEASLGRRAREADEALRRARAEGDEHAVVTHTGDLENLLRLARRHGIEVDGVTAPGIGTAES
jgi:cell division ATPase FtsA